MKTLIQMTAIASVAALPAFAEMGDHDSDGDKMLNDMEFGEAEGGDRFGDYDTDGSGDVSEDEFKAGEFKRYDRDQSGSVDEEEYGRYEEDRGEED